MPRTARRCPGGVVYHVLNRSAARFKLFRSEKDYLAFGKTLVEAMTRFSINLLAYCIMPNHWHLVLQPHHDGDLSKFMQWLTLAHAQRWRTSHGTVGYGSLYQGRFKSFAIERDRHRLIVLRYAERNALRAGLVEHAEDWRWSSLYRRLHAEIVPHVVLSEWPIERPSDWVRLVNTPQSAAEEEAIKQSIYRSRPYGSENWQQQTAKRLGLRSCFRSPGRPRQKP